MNQQRTPRAYNLLLPFLIVALIFGVMLYRKYRSSTEVPPTPQIQQPGGQRTSILFFVSGGNRLSREARSMDACADRTECVRSALEELFNGPVGELEEAIPEGVPLNGVQVDGDLATVDLGSSFAELLAGGSAAEMVAVYAIVNTVCTNEPSVTRVRITLDGQVATLRHLDLNEPLTPDYTLERDAAPVTPPDDHAAEKPRGNHRK